MIVHALQFVRDRINVFTSPGGPGVELENIARYNAGAGFNDKLEDKILMSIINVEEDTIVRQVEHYRKENNQVIFKNPPVYINITLMFACTHADYDSALIGLECVILFFQKHNFLSIDNSPELESFNQLHNLKVEKMTFQICNFNIEQISQLWAAFGSHYMPSVIYKMRMLQLDNATEIISQPIQDIKIEAWHKKQKA